MVTYVACMAGFFGGGGGDDEGPGFLGAGGGGIGRLFSTHPPIADRIARLEAMAGYRR